MLVVDSFKIDSSTSNLKMIGFFVFSVNSAEPLTQDQLDALLSEESWDKIRAALAVRHHLPPFGCRRRHASESAAAEAH